MTIYLKLCTVHIPSNEKNKRNRKGPNNKRPSEAKRGKKDKNASSALIQTERRDLDMGYKISTHERRPRRITTLHHCQESQAKAIEKICLRLCVKFSTNTTEIIVQRPCITNKRPWRLQRIWTTSAKTISISIKVITQTSLKSLRSKEKL